MLILNLTVILLQSTITRRTRLAQESVCATPISSRYRDLQRTEIDQKPVPGKATDCPSQIVITVIPDQRRGRYRAYIGTEPKPLCVSRQPFLDGARKLLERGHDRRTILVMRWAGAKDWALRGSLGAAAKLTVDEHNGTFAKWKPYSRSAVPPGNANSARTVPQTAAPLKKLIPETTAEKTGERRVRPDAAEIH